MSNDDLQPDTSEVLQSEDDDAGSYTVKVCVEDVKGPVRTQELPRKGGSTRTIALTTTVIPVLRADHFRGAALLVGFTNDLLVGFGKGSGGDPSTMARWPALVPLPITAAIDVYVGAFTGAATLSVITERWATGE